MEDNFGSCLEQHQSLPVQPLTRASAFLFPSASRFRTAKCCPPDFFRVFLLFGFGQPSLILIWRYLAPLPQKCAHIFFSSLG